VIVGDEDARALPAGEIGTVWLKTHPGEEFDYFGDREKTERNQRGSWYTLGDLGWVDDDGYLFLSGRSAELIISGGVNVYPAEIDAVLLEHPRCATRPRSAYPTTSGARRCSRSSRSLHRPARRPSSRQT